MLSRFRSFTLVGFVLFCGNGCVHGQKFCRNFKVSPADVFFVLPLFGPNHQLSHRGFGLFFLFHFIHLVSGPLIESSLSKTNTLMFLWTFSTLISRVGADGGCKCVLQTHLAIFDLQVNATAERRRPLPSGEDVSALVVKLSQTWYTSRLAAKQRGLWETHDGNKQASLRLGGLSASPELDD